MKPIKDFFADMTAVLPPLCLGRRDTGPFGLRTEIITNLAASVRYL